MVFYKNLCLTVCYSYQSWQISCFAYVIQSTWLLAFPFLYPLVILYHTIMQLQHYYLVQFNDGLSPFFLCSYWCQSSLVRCVTSVKISSMLFMCLILLQPVVQRLVSRLPLWSSYSLCTSIIYWHLVYFCISLKYTDHWHGPISLSR